MWSRISLFQFCRHETLLSSLCGIYEASCGVEHLFKIAV
jgi:hypothetical protein